MALRTPFPLREIFMHNRKVLSMVAGLATAFAFASLFPRNASAETDPKTVRTWKAKCASCHGVDGKAKTETGAKLAIPDMTAAAWQKKVSDADMKKAILEGFKREGKPEGMDPFKDSLTPEQIDQLVAYVRTFGKS
jgi:mono/diheme cytochrome c family protein